MRRLVEPGGLGLEEDPDLERRFRVFAAPVALAIAFLLCSFARPLLRIFFSMWVHEIGHALTAWLCGLLAFPGPWLTPMATERSAVFSLLLLAALAYGAFARPARRLLFAFLAGLLVCCTFLLPLSRARELVVFMGDGGCLVLGTALMLAMHVRRLREGWLRWGFLVIGAAAFADVFSLWWGARTDPDLIPFGMNEGAGLSDPSVLSDQFGWSAHTLVGRYVALGCACLFVNLAASLRALLKSADR